MKKSLIFAAIILLLALGAIILWWQWPERVATSALHRLGEAETQQFTANLSIADSQTSQTLLGESTAVELILTGAYQRQSEARDSLSTGIKLVTTTEGLMLNIEGEARFLDDQVYLKINKSPQAFPLLSQLKGKWLVFPRGGDNDPSSDQVEIDNLLTDVSRQGSEDINSTRTTKYSAQATTEAVIAMLDNIADILGTRLTAEQVDSIQQSVTQLDTVPVELWVTPYSHELKQLSARLTMAGGNAVTFNFQPEGRNQPVDITTPDDPVALEEALPAN